MLQEAKTLIERAWDNQKLVKENATKEAIEKIIGLLGTGTVRVAEPACTGEWLVNEWIKKAVSLYFTLLKKEFDETGILRTDENPEKKEASVHSGAIIRKGACINHPVIIGNSTIDVGAYIAAGTKIDSYSNIGSCTQIGNNVIICSGVHISDNLQQPEKYPVVIENNSFIGVHSILSNGLHVGKNVIIGPHVIISGNSEIIDTSGRKQIKLRGTIPDNSIVIRGYQKMKSHRGRFVIPSAFIIGKHDGTEHPEIILEKALSLLRKK